MCYHAYCPPAHCCGWPDAGYCGLSSQSGCGLSNNCQLQNSGPLDNPNGTVIQSRGAYCVVQF